MRKGVNKKYIELLGKNIALVRKQKKVTQEELSYRADITLSQIARIETGAINTTVNTLFIIAKALDVHPKEIFDFDFTGKK